MRLLAFFIMFGFAAFISSQQAFADCVNPAGEESKIIYNSDHKVMQYCNGTNWIGMAGGSSSIMEGDTMAESIPDALKCRVNADGRDWFYFIVADHRSAFAADNDIFYRLIERPTGTADLFIIIDGDTNTVKQDSTGTSCSGKTISQLYDDGQACNFVGGGVVGGAGGADTLAGLSCTDGQMVVYDNASSAWVCVDVSASGAADNLGDHTATQDLDLATNEILNVSGIEVSPVTGAEKPNNFENPSLWTQAGSDIYVTGGNVGIGTTTPSATLDVNGEFRSAVGNSAALLTNSANESTLWLQDNSSNKYWQYKHDIANGNHLNVMYYDGSAWSAPLTVLPSGNVGIGGTASPSYKLHVIGQVAGNAAYVNTSDARLKKDVADISYGLSDVMKLRPVTFYWKEQDEDWQKGRKVGLIAQEVEKIAPEVVSTADDEMKTKSIAYGDLVPLLIKSVQEQQAMIEKLEAANDNLREEVDALKHAVAQ
ncbi:MAG: tail fiber domain-containing protein [Nisaea sp.]|uniref:tail fiber domain-containing protein n=1 Tax=Nisaea sp. TaxID=2024842 RepID=UPI0032665E18